MPTMSLSHESMAEVDALVPVALAQWILPHDSSGQIRGLPSSILTEIQFLAKDNPHNTPIFRIQIATLLSLGEKRAEAATGPQKVVQENMLEIAQRIADARGGIRSNETYLKQACAILEEHVWKTRLRNDALYAEALLDANAEKIRVVMEKQEKLQREFQEQKEELENEKKKLEANVARIHRALGK